MLDLLERVTRITSDKNFKKHLSNGYMDAPLPKMSLTIPTETLTDKKLKEYKPTAEKVEKFSSGDQLFFIDVSVSISNLTPFIRDGKSEESEGTYPIYKQKIHKVFTHYIAGFFNNEQINRMNTLVQQDLIDRLLILTEKAFELNRHHFFESGYLYYDEFESNRLKHLVEFGEEAIEISKKDYLYLKFIFLEFIKEMVVNAFKTAKYEANTKVFNFNIGNDIYQNGLIKFYINFAKRFPYVNIKVKKEMFCYFTELFSINKEFNWAWVKDYENISFCPFSTMLMTTGLMGKSNFLSVIDFNKLEVILSKHKMDLIAENLILMYETHYTVYINEEIKEYDYIQERFLLNDAFQGLTRLKKYLESK